MGTAVCWAFRSRVRYSPDVCDSYLPLPSLCFHLMPIVAIVPIQLYAYHTAVIRGCDVDRPRNLAKSVTVE